MATTIEHRVIETSPNGVNFSEDCGEDLARAERIAANWLRQGKYLHKPNKVVIQTTITKEVTL